MIAVLDYGIGNLRSAQKGLEKVGADAELTADPNVIAAAEGVVLPGVGAFGRCMNALRDAGLDEPARHAIASGQPFLGICIGFQMLYDGSEESPGVDGLGVLPGKVRMLSESVKRPQMQWNVVRHDEDSPLFAHMDDPVWMYFVHSYAPADDSEFVVARCNYGGQVAAAVHRANLWGTQFHPEKSGKAGLQFLTNFVAACRAA